MCLPTAASDTIARNQDFPAAGSIVSNRLNKDITFKFAAA